MNVIIAIDKQDKVLTNIASNLVELLDKELLNPSLDIVPLTRDVNLFMSNRWDNMKEKKKKKSSVCSTTRPGHLW